MAQRQQNAAAKGCSKHKTAPKDAAGDNSEDLTWEELKDRVAKAAEERLSRSLPKDCGEVGLELEIRRGTCHQGLLPRWVADLQLKRKSSGTAAQASWLLCTSWAKGQAGWELILHSTKDEKQSRTPLRPKPENGGFEDGGNVLALLIKKNRDGALGRQLERPQRLLLRSQLSQEPVKLLGKGAFGAVNLYQFQSAVEPKEKLQLAVKTPTNLGTQKAFLEECFLSLKAGGHEAVVDYVGVFGLGMEGGLLGLGMEQCGWGDLKSVLESRERRPSEPRVLAEWALSCARGVAHVAALGIIHRDIAARNFLVGFRKGQPCPLLSDFGLARQASEWRTAEGESVTSVAYIADQGDEVDDDAEG